MYKYHILTRRGKVIMRTNSTIEAEKAWNKAKKSGSGAALYMCPKPIARIQ